MTNSSARTYFAHNEVRGDAETSSFARDLNDSSFLHDISESGIPQSTLTLRTGDIAFITRTINKEAGLVTNRRVTIVGLGEKVITVLLHDEDNTGRIAHIPRVTHEFSPGQSQLEIRRTQFPLRLAYAITYNKAQGECGIFETKRIASGVAPKI